MKVDETRCILEARLCALLERSEGALLPEASRVTK